jgi:UDP-N-acetyl-2-amino-2-deoxyglucuronate dehydrogenase
MEKTKQLTKPLNFGLLGVGGYIAPKHLKAIKETGNNLVSAMDKNDSVGILDSYFPECKFFTEFERYERHCEKQAILKGSEALDYVSICTPNYLHDAHIRFALRVGANVICEKPLVLNPWNLESLVELEKQTGKKVNTVLQLRYHPAIKELKERVSHEIEKNPHRRYNVDLNYITPRGNWYGRSWKADSEKSGGVATNIGIHLFDMLLWTFGDVKAMAIGEYNDKRINGYLDLEHASINWNLSTSKYDLPEDKQELLTQHRSIVIDNHELDFTTGFNDLHTEVYKQILAGNGFGIKDALPSIKLVSEIRKKIKY